MSSKIKGKNIFVTGATGFVGSHITNYLVNNGANVTVLIERKDASSYFNLSGLENKVNVYYGNIKDYELIEQIIGEKRIETIFHLAAIALQDIAYVIPRITFEVNILGTYNILEAARRHCDTVKNVIVASSDKVYGDSNILPYTEDQPLNGRNPYDVSKVCQDMLARSYYTSYGLPVVVGRFGNIYGPGDNNTNRLIPGTISRVMNGEKPVIRKPANGYFKRDFLYVDDIVNGYMLMLEHINDDGVTGNAFNFGTGIATNIEEVVKKICIIMNGENIEPEIDVCVNEEIIAQQLDPHKAELLLGWKAKYSIDEGLRKTIDCEKNITKYYNRI